MICNFLKNAIAFSFALSESEAKNIKEQECILVGCVPSAAVAISGGGVYQEGVSAQGGVSPGVSTQGGVWHTPMNRITDRCRNITLLQLGCGR